MEQVFKDQLYICIIFGIECTLEDSPLRKLKGVKGILALSIASERAGSQRKTESKI